MHQLLDVLLQQLTAFVVADIWHVFLQQQALHCHVAGTCNGTAHHLHLCW